MGKAKNIATAGGAGIGIAGALGAISGAFPLAVLGAYAARKIDGSSFAEEVSVAYKAKDAEFTATRRRKNESHVPPTE